MKTPEEKGDWIKSQHWATFRKLLAEAESLAAGESPFNKRMRRLTDITDGLAAKVAKVAICQKGCSHCCYQPLIISRWEANRIGRHIGREPEPGNGSEALMEKARKEFDGKPCVFLKHGVCSVYEVRPLVCRTHFSLANDPSLCDTFKHPGTDVPYFNFGPLTIASALVLIDEPHADIREFFP